MNAAQNENRINLHLHQIQTLKFSPNLSSYSNSSHQKKKKKVVFATIFLPDLQWKVAETKDGKESFSMAYKRMSLLQVMGSNGDRRGENF